MERCWKCDKKTEVGVDHCRNCGAFVDIDINDHNKYVGISLFFAFVCMAGFVVGFNTLGLTMIFLGAGLSWSAYNQWQTGQERLRRMSRERSEYIQANRNPET